MKTKTTRVIDQAGRVSIPGYLRELSGINTGDTVNVEVDNDGIHIYSSVDRCCICGESQDADNLLPVTIGHTEHKFCVNCAKTIVNTLEKKEATK